MTSSSAVRRGHGIRISTAFTAFALVTSLAACGDSEATDAADQPCDTGESSATGEFPRTVEHHKGETTLDKAPTKIVVLDPSLVEAALAVDGVVVGGVGSYGRSREFPPYLGDVTECITEVGPLEGPNLEEIAALEPDLIVSASIRHEEIHDELSDIAPTVFVETTGPQWKDNLTLLGEAIGTEDKAAQELAAYEERAAAIGAAINEKENDPQMSVVRFMDGPTRLMGNTSFTGIVFADMGLARPEVQDVDEFAVEIGEEEIRKADGDHIFVSVYADGGEAAEERFLRNPLWEQLEAVENGNVHDVDDTTWMLSVSLQGADIVLDDMAELFGVDAAK